MVRPLTGILILCAALLTASMPAPLHAQSDTIVLRTAASAAAVPVLRTDSGSYLPIRSLSAFLGADHYENRALRKLEVKFPRSTVKFTAGNAFVVVSSASSKRNKVYQLTLPVLFTAGAYYASADELPGLFRLTGDSTLSVAEAGSTAPAVPAAAPVVTGLSVEEKKNGTLFRIALTAPVRDFNRSLQVGDWVYVTLPGAQCDTVAFDTTFASGIIRRVKPVQSETSLQLSLQVRGKVAQSEIVQDPLSNDILLTLIPPEPEPPKTAAVDSAALLRKQNEKARQDVVRSIAKQKQKWKLDVVVIDPGHGGHDPGAIGIIGTREKDITLGIALKLGEMIRKELPDVKVVFTRKTDRFVELYRRGQIANENEGKLFISIHCNSTERKPSSANGFEIYLLRPGKTEDAIRIAEKENDVVKLEKDYEDRYQELTEENFIILTMAQSAYVKQSERFAEMLEETMSAQMEGMRQPVKQAGFYVLVGASMPNVLLESGYLSNVKDEKFLRSPAGQQKIATAILNALKGYKNEYEDENR
ncbi:MAG: N-acetylmuramoyl-L-alanine amidase [Bacteroidetes bacterium]|nr:N-acetylmuramoyl-L-alanine amidase [Bacteroidota bacterium]